MKSISIGDMLINPKGRKLILFKWKPGDGIYAIGNWLLRDSSGRTLRVSTVELGKWGYSIRRDKAD